MDKDPRYKTVKILIEGGHISQLKEVWDNIPKSVVAADTGKNYKRFARVFNNLTQLKVEDIILLADIIEVDKRSIFNLVANQIDDDKTTRRKK